MSLNASGRISSTNSISTKPRNYSPRRPQKKNPPRSSGMAALVICVRLHDGRYHGKDDWPPSPARLFQALVAGAGLSGPLEKNDREALKWLEQQPAPIIAAPRAWQPREGVLFYMPNNDSDRIEGDLAKLAKI